MSHHPTITLKTKPRTIVVKGASKGPTVVLVKKTKPCPFCGDTRKPDTEEKKLKFERSSIFFAVCQCCGADGPVANTRGAALILWDERRAPGDTTKFCKLAERIS